MNKREWIMCASLALFIVGLVVFWLTLARNRFIYGKLRERTKAPLPAQPVEIVSAVNKPQGGMNIGLYIPEPWKRVNEKAGAITDGNERAIRELADSVLQLITSDRPPSAILRPLMGKVAQAEINYRSGQKSGIPEANIVRVIEHLALRLGAPNYARTDEDEVRYLRLDISQMMPNFIPRWPLGVGEESLAVFPYTVDPLMSPLEAVYVTHSLITQKEFSDFFLLTAEERADVKAAINKLKEMGIRLTRRERAEVMLALTQQKLHPENAQLSVEELAVEAQRRSAEPENNHTQSALQFWEPPTSRHKKMKEVFDRAYRMKVGDALELASKSIELLGI
jgi:hypothetical protein